MPPPLKPISREKLQYAEQTYTEQLAQEPGDTDIRLSLAWCLAMQACFEAGHEDGQTVSASTGGEPADSHTAAASLGHVFTVRDSRLLLQTCLRQAGTVIQLTLHAGERAEAARLRALISLSGGEQELAEADSHAARVLADLTEAIWNDTDVSCPPPAPRRHVK